MTALKRVILVGANGKLGPHILQALLDTPQFEVSVLSRASSSSKYSGNVNVVRVGDDLPSAELREALKGQDALVIAYSGTQTENSIKLADAAFAANVKHIIPADFGSCDSSDPVSLSLIPLYVNKKDVRDYLIKLSTRKRDDGSVMTWTSLVTGHFFDYGLKSGLLSMDIDRSTATVFDDGAHKFAATTLPHIALATVRTLQKYDNPRLSNRLVYVQSIQTTQNDLVKVVKQVTNKQVKTSTVKSEQFIAKYKKLLADKPDDPEITEHLVTVGGIVNTDWDSKGTAFVNDLLEMPDCDLSSLVEDALR